MAAEVPLQGSIQKRSQDRIDAGEWKSSSTKGHNEIPPLGSNPYNCNCKFCKAILKETACWTKAKKDDINVDIKIGDRVLIQGALPGVAKYIGDLDSSYTNGQVYIGVKLDDPVGEHDGVFQNKRFFECPNMHGVIVPIEDVHLLVPADGRTITVNKPAKFLSASNLESLSNSKKESHSSNTSEMEVVLHTMSEGRLSNPLPEIETRVIRPSIDTTPKDIQKLFSQDGVTRSGVFISDFPGSIAAQIFDSGSDSAMKEKLLKSLSQYCDSGKTNADCCVSGVEDKVEEVIVLSEDSSKQPTAQAATKAPPCTPVSSGLNTKSPVRNKYHPPSASMHTVGVKNPLAKISQVGGSKSAAVDLKKLGTPSPLISKLATNKVTANQVPNSTEPVEKCDKEPSKTKTQAEISREKQVEGKKAGSSAESTPVVPILRLLPSSEEKSELSQKPTIAPVASYTSHLLSGLPREDAITPLSGNTKMNDMHEFRQWVEKWGGGTKGWAKAQTLQKLKEAQRKGEKELMWQKSIDCYEKYEKHAPAINKIRKLQDEILKVRERCRPTELKFQEHRTQITYSTIRKEVNELEAQTKTLCKVNESLLQKVLGHPLFDLVEEAIEYVNALEDEEEDEEYLLVDELEPELQAEQELVPQTED